MVAQLTNSTTEIAVDNIMFARVHLPVLDKKLAAEQILGLPDSYSFWDDYRYTKMIPLMTKNGQGSVAGAINSRDGEFSWVPYAPDSIVSWFEQTVFPWMGTRSRIMALITEPGVSNYEHIDCDPHQLNTKQHKFRIVLQGTTDTLYFKTTAGDVYAPCIEDAFIMDGGWPHGMINRGSIPKVTLALGAPWTGHDVYDNIDLLMNRLDHEMPEDLSGFWKKK